MIESWEFSRDLSRDERRISNGILIRLPLNSTTRAVFDAFRVSGLKDIIIYYRGTSLRL